MTVVAIGQTTIFNDLILQKLAPKFYLNGSGALISFYNGDIVLTQSANLLTLSGGNLSLGANNFYLTGSIGQTGSRVLKGWFTDLDMTNAPTIAGVSFSATFAPINNPTFTGTVGGITATMVGLGNVTNESKATMFNSATGTGTWILPATTSIGTVSAADILTLVNVTSDIQTQINTKQATLVSGTNIKTVGGTTILGSGNIPIAGTGTVTSVGVTSAHGVSAVITDPTGAADMTFTLSAITPSSIVASGTVVGSNLSGTNTGDNATNTLYSGLVTNATHTGDATGSGALIVSRLNGVSLGSLATGLLKNTTSTGVPSIAISGVDYVVPSGNITGNAATATKLETSRTINGVGFDGTANITVTAIPVTPGPAGDLLTSTGVAWESAQLDTIPLTTSILDPDVAALIEAQIQAALLNANISAGTFYYLKGRVGVTDGLPDDGDSLLIHTNFIGKHVNVFREGQLQQQNPDNTDTDGFWFDNATGKITFRPILAANEQLEVWSTNTILWEALIPEGGSGGGGSPPGTPLLDSLLAYYSLDEVAGTTIDDKISNDGTTTATVNQVGKLGRSELFNGTTYATIPNAASLLPQKDEMTFACWFYLITLPSVAGHYGYIARFRDGTAPYYMASVYITTTNYIEFDITNIAGTEFGYETAAAAVVAGQWYHLCVVNEGNGVDAKIYLNGANITSYHPNVFMGDLLQFDSVISIGNHSSGSALGILGYIDEVGYWDEALTGAQVTELYNAGTGITYPFE